MRDTPSIIVRREPGYSAPTSPVVAFENESLPSSLRVLIVEDVPDEAEMLRLQLVSWGLSPWVTHKATRVLELAESYRPHVILLDLGLPDLHGFDVARQLRACSWGKAMKLVALTGWAQDADRAHARGAGIDHHLAKPVDARLLYDVLSERNGGLPG